MQLKLTSFRAMVGRATSPLFGAIAVIAKHLKTGREVLLLEPIIKRKANLFTMGGTVVVHMVNREKREPVLSTARTDVQSAAIVRDHGRTMAFVPSLPASRRDGLQSLSVPVIKSSSLFSYLLSVFDVTCSTFCLVGTSIVEIILDALRRVFVGHGRYFSVKP